MNSLVWLAITCAAWTIPAVASLAQETTERPAWAKRWDGTFLPDATNTVLMGKLKKATPPHIRPAGQANAVPQRSTLAEAISLHDQPIRPIPITSTSDVVMLDTLVPLSDPTIQQDPVRMASLTAQTLPIGSEITELPANGLPPGTRSGVFQKVRMSGTWTPALTEEPDALGITDLDTSVVLGFPFLTVQTPLLVTPRFSMHFLDNAAAIDAPSRVYDAAVEFRHLRRFGEGPWAMDAAVSVGYYSDFQINTGDAVRVNGRALAVYESSPAAKWIFGVVYFNRLGTQVLPAAGLLYEPNANMKIDLIYPRPRIAWRLPEGNENDQSWAYLGGEFGGGVWSVRRRSTGALDTLNYTDLWLLAGYERKIIGGLSRHYEIGYVFAREIEFEQPATRTSLDDALFLRAGLSY